LNVDTVVLIGKTGSGKGTQAKFIAEEFGYKLFSTGDNFRELRLENTPLGRRVKEDYDEGLLMPHWLASFLFQKALLGLKDGESIVFEGTGRTLPESQVFDEVCKWLRRNYVVFYLKVSDEEVIKRQQKRQRDSLDQIDKIKKRLEEYRLHTALGVEFFREKGKLIEIDGEQSPEDVQKEILAYLEK